MISNYGQPGANLPKYHPVILDILKDLAAKKAPPIKSHPLDIDLTQTGQSPLLQMGVLKKLKVKIREGQEQIAKNIALHHAQIIPRTQACNRKSCQQTIDAERQFRSTLLSEQIRVWKSVLPSLIRKFSRIPDPRRAKSLSHRITVVMMFGLFAFIFRLTSRREMNRELTGVVIYENLKKIFPEIDSIPHADTLARILEQINPQRIEDIHVSLIQELIRKRNSRSFLFKAVYR